MKAALAGISIYQCFIPIDLFEEYTSTWKVIYILDHRGIGKSSLFWPDFPCYMPLTRKQGLYLPGNVIRAPHGAKTDDSRLLQKLLKNFAWNSTRKSSLPCLMFKVTIYWISKTGKKNVCKIIFRQDQIQTWLIAVSEIKKALKIFSLPSSSRSSGGHLFVVPSWLTFFMYVLKELDFLCRWMMMPP